jgi:hypothetical protein
MKTLVLALSLVFLLMTGSYAGPNEGVVLTAHGNVDGLDPGDHPCIVFPIPPTCEETDPNAAPDSEGVEWYIILAAGTDELAFNMITFGIGLYDPYACYLVSWGPCFPELGGLEIPSGGWPGPGTGTSVSWSPNCLTGELVPVYYFAFYVYNGGGPVPLGDFYPGAPAYVTGCDDPPQSDHIEDPDGDGFFGIIGCGDDPGKRECPQTSSVPDADSSSGNHEMTWGRIKNIYR